jgi:hypothetical protein
VTDRGGITQTLHDEIATDLEKRQQELNDRLKMLTSDNKSFLIASSYLLDLANRAEELFKCSDEGLRSKLLGFLLSNIQLNEKKLSFTVNYPYNLVLEAKEKSLNGSETSIWCSRCKKVSTSSRLNWRAGEMY